MLHRTGILLALLFSVAWTSTAKAQTQAPPTPTAPPLPYISAPSSGQALQGKVAVTGRSRTKGFRGYEISFAYAHEPFGAWFLIFASDEPVREGLLAEWDTSMISDGNYTLRLVVYRDDEEPLIVIVDALRVRNYTPVETVTPTSLSPTATQEPGEPTRTPIPTETPPAPTVTPLPTNTAILTGQALQASMLKASLAVVGLFAIGGIYYITRRLRRGL